MNTGIYTILIIDDDRENIDIVQRKLKDRSLRFFTAESGAEGIALARKERPDLIILDWQMPGFSGIETLKVLRADSLTVAIPVMMMTGVMKESKHLEEAFDAGASDFIRKPIDGIELRSRVSAAISLREEQAKRQELERIILLKEIARTEQELVALSIQFTVINEVVEKFVREVRAALISSRLQGPLQMIEKDITRFRREMFTLSWTKIESKFKETHSGFLTVLANRFPELTENELKLSVLFAMGLSTRDISAITFVSYEGIRKARTRLRKKLQLGSEVDVTEYLKSIA